MMIKVKVKPGAKEERVEKISDDEYCIDVKEPAEDSKANAKVIKLLSRELGASWRKIKIKNPASREKIVEIFA
jgi:uncharacterized protein YggU (UPF0235/DUF167 family)